MLLNGTYLCTDEMTLYRAFDSPLDDRGSFLSVAGRWWVPVVGDLPWLVAEGPHRFFRRCSLKYGAVFQVSAACWG
jgi:hypothetical protein